jgi:hypothetical protein
MNPTLRCSSRSTGASSGPTAPPYDSITTPQGIFFHTPLYHHKMSFQPSHCQSLSPIPGDFYFCRTIILYHLTKHVSSPTSRSKEVSERLRPTADTSPPNGGKVTNTSNPTSTLTSQPAEGNRHIRIVELGHHLSLTGVSRALTEQYSSRACASSQWKRNRDA